MKPQILRLDESALYALGMDRVTVNALRNIIRVTGADSMSPTVPEVAEAAGLAGKLITQLQEKISVLQTVVDLLQSAPTDSGIDLSPMDALSLAPAPLDQQPPMSYDDLRLDTRQLSEQVAALMKMVELDVRPNMDQFAQFSNQIITELRYLSDQQIINSNQIQELKQGTML